jgi:hypothetical protein
MNEPARNNRRHQGSDGERGEGMIEELLRKFQNDAIACGSDDYNESASFRMVARREARMEESKKAIIDYVKGLEQKGTNV